MKKLFVIAVLVLFSITNLFAQGERSEWKLGVRLDINMVKEQTMTGIDDQPKVIQKTHFSNRYISSPVSIYFPLNYLCSQKVELELRPGLLMRGSELSSYALGLYANYYLLSNLLFISGGLENTLHMAGIDVGDQSHTTIAQWTRVTGYNDDEIHTAVVLGLGIKTSETISLEVSFTKPFSEQYGYYQVVDEKNHFNLPDGKYPMKLFWMVKFGLNIFIF
jgi:hypothetical protein